MKKRFRGLRWVARLSKGVGSLLLIAGLFLAAQVAQGSLYIPFAPPAAAYSSDALWAAAGLFAPFLLGFLVLYGGGGALGVLIAIEDNTRGAARGAVPIPPPEGQGPPQDEAGGTPPDAAGE